jgi:DNA replication protein DnaC
MTFETFESQGRGLPPDKQRNLQRAYEIARKYAEHPRGWLVLLGGYGCGKTHLAAAIANACVERGEVALLVVVPDLLDYLRATFAPESSVSYDERFEAIRNAPLLILDDLGTESSTLWAEEKLYQIFNYRYVTRLPTVITSNRKLEEIDPRLRSRMVDPELCQVYQILAPDYRSSGVDQIGSGLNSLSLHHEEVFETFDLREGELPPAEAENLRYAFRLARAFAERPEGWLVLTGDYGCGKTHLAAAIANYRRQEGQPVYFVVVPDLLDHLRAAFSPQSSVSYDKRFEEVRTAPLLVLDDLGTGSTTPWAVEKLSQILNYRYSARLPTVITTSSPIESIEPRLRSRMLDQDRCRIVAILAPTYKGTFRTSVKNRVTKTPHRG